jgi:hypothetical protein
LVGEDDRRPGGVTPPPKNHVSLAASRGDKSPRCDTMPLRGREKPPVLAQQRRTPFPSVAMNRGAVGSRLVDYPSLPSPNQRRHFLLKKKSSPLIWGGSIHIPPASGLRPPFPSAPGSHGRAGAGCPREAGVSRENLSRSRATGSWDEGDGKLGIRNQKKNGGQSVDRLIFSRR